MPLHDRRPFHTWARHFGTYARQATDPALDHVPEGTATHRPIAHRTLIQQLSGALNSMGLHAIWLAHSAWANDNRYAGLLCLTPRTAERHFENLIILARNSHDQSYSAQATTGLWFPSDPLVDDDDDPGVIIWAGETFRFARRHTSRINENLHQRISESLTTLLDTLQPLHQRLDNYARVPIPSRRWLHDLLIRGLLNDCYSSSKIGRILSYLSTPEVTFGQLLHATIRMEAEYPSHLSAPERHARLLILLDEIFQDAVRWHLARRALTAPNPNPLSDTPTPQETPDAALGTHVDVAG